MNVRDYARNLAEEAKKASRILAAIPTERKNRALLATAELLKAGEKDVAEANRRDLEAGGKAGLSAALLDRLRITPQRLGEMRRGLAQVAGLPDPVGKVIDERTRPNGLLIRRIRVPLGVVCVIYESRPNVTIDSAGLCLKSGNAAILRGGKEALNSNGALAAIMQRALRETGLPPDAVKLVSVADRAVVGELVTLDRFIDIVITRGGESLIRAVAAEATVPVIKHYKGVCHVYVAASADPEMALEIADNAKTQRPGVCNAMETLLVDSAIAPMFLPRLRERLEGKKVELRGCPRTREILPGVQEATEDDWYAEYLDLILAVRVVDGAAAAIEHIATYGSNHSDAIVTRDDSEARLFTERVDSAAVYVNASTRFTDGGEFGLGAEIGISTDKLHARGPMGLEELTTYKWVIWGNGQTRQ
ncbi:MAG: glutamate-5-semialdehyde dehydrogenase [Candidatus Aureabacteria bacterium]|nr:glutamate-5-semialdehyde dehydrogenase [Candidatus Auribacterota bacterium]